MDGFEGFARRHADGLVRMSYVVYGAGHRGPRPDSGRWPVAVAGGSVGRWVDCAGAAPAGRASGAAARQSLRPVAVAGGPVDRLCRCGPCGAGHRGRSSTVAGAAARRCRRWPSRAARWIECAGAAPAGRASRAAARQSLTVGGRRGGPVDRMCRCGPCGAGQRGRSPTVVAAVGRRGGPVDRLCRCGPCRAGQRGRTPTVDAAGGRRGGPVDRLCRCGPCGAGHQGRSPTVVGRRSGPSRRASPPRGR